MAQKLENMKCVACTGATSVLSRKSISSLLKRIPGWRFVKATKGIKGTKGKKGIKDMKITSDRIERIFRFKDFKHALDFVHKVGTIADSQGHHPNIFMHDWNKVTITLYTHAINGLSENDFIVAAKINALKV